jgi:hypothetical protein
MPEKGPITKTIPIPHARKNHILPATAEQDVAFAQQRSHRRDIS